jgi:DNA-binding NarL/FixJ family response regulator
MSDKKESVVIVDDHPLFRERLSQLINHELDMEVCGEAENAQQGIQLIRNTCPDLAIVDITLKGSSGLELIKSIRALSIDIPVLVLSMHDEALYAERALRAGATGYITKHQAADQIILAVRRVLAGEVYLSERMIASFLKSLTTGGVKSIPRPVDRLTDRELEVLELIGSGLTTREIAEAVKKQQMQWTLRGAHLLLQTRTKVLNEDLDDLFRRWYPKFRPQPPTQEPDRKAA